MNRDEPLSTAPPDPRSPASTPLTPLRRRPNKAARAALITGGALFALFLAAEAAGLILMARSGSIIDSADETAPTDAMVAKLPARKKEAERRLAALAPRGVFIVIDSGLNVLTLRKGGEVLREAVVSCGSGDILEDPNGKRSWVFDTPRGEFAVNSKLVDPDWIKPDWAFIEEGEAPPKKFDDRVDSAMLGDYALGFGNGYFIHGTLYTRLLGRNVTHGCIRVGDKDLEAVYRTVPIGTKIFIF